MKRTLIILATLVVLLLAYPLLSQQLGTHALLRLMPHTFADLAMADMTGRDAMAITDGYITYCTDCAVPAHPGDKCAVGGSGAEAHRIRGAWVCY
jgi:hypothetical protein